MLKEFAFDSSDERLLVDYKMRQIFNDSLYHECSFRVKKNTHRKILSNLNSKFIMYESARLYDFIFTVYKEGFIVVYMKGHGNNDKVSIYRKVRCKLLPIFYCLKNSLLKKKENNSYLIVHEYNRLSLQDFGTKSQNIIVEENYNDNVVKDYKKIKDGLLDDESESLVLMYSAPGCGKTSLIRKMVSDIKKDFVYLPNNLISMFAEPAFMSFAIDSLTDKVLIVEDAENILTSRKSSNNPYVSTILNLTDGLMKDILNIKIICTINNDINTIDEALLRKGRLLLKTELSALEVVKTNKLLKKLGYDYESSEPMKLSDIYNFDKETNIGDKKKMGFGK